MNKIARPLPRPYLPPRPARGFTLVELMVALVVLSILFAVAVPSLMGSLRKARRGDAQDITTRVAHAQERWRANNPAYSANLATDLGLTSNSSGTYYTLALTGVAANAYTLTVTAATGKSQVKDTGCSTLVMAVTNGNAAYTPAGCWSR